MIRTKNDDGTMDIKLDSFGTNLQYVVCNLEYNPDTNKYVISNNYPPCIILSDALAELRTTFYVDAFPLIDASGPVVDYIDLTELTAGFVGCITPSQIEGKPLAAAVIKFKDEEYDYATGEGINILAVYECRYNASYILKI